MQKLYDCEVIADSISDRDDRLTTLMVTMPRFILPEFNTHRMFSRNSASSRAIPVKKRIAMVMNDPFAPDSFGRNKEGMQATENLEGPEAKKARDLWLDVCGYNCAAADALAKLGVHKQYANRLVELWSPQTVLVTATEWENFWALRISEMAQPEIRRAAESMKAAYDASTPRLTRPDGDAHDWHFPFDEGAHHAAENILGDVPWNEKAHLMGKICCGRCARVSYLTHDGKRDPAADLALAERVLASGHMSPFEHVARPMTDAEWYIFASPDLLMEKISPKAFCGNFNGWIQFRKTIRGEAVYTGE